METLQLLITDNNILLNQKGNTILKHSFSSDQECFAQIAEAIKPYKNYKVSCFFSGSRLESQTRTIHFAQKDPFTADQDMVDRLIENAKHAFHDDVKNDQLELVSTSLRSLSLNGYNVKELKKDKAVDLMIVVFFAALPATFRKNVIKALSPVTENNITLGSFAESLVDRAYQHSHDEEFITCSAYEHSTDISIRKSGNFFETVTIPLGTHHVLEHISTGLTLSNEDAEAHLALYNENHIDPVLTAKVEAAILSFEISLDEEIKKALTVLAEGIALPSHVYLLVAPFYRKAYEGAFKSDSYHSLCFSTGGFEVKNLSSILTS